jgi:hypothetical protein
MRTHMHIPHSNSAHRSTGRWAFSRRTRSGKARTAILLWLLGIPIPVILLIFLLKSCM